MPPARRTASESRRRPAPRHLEPPAPGEVERKIGDVITFEDAKTFTTPVTIKVNQLLIPDSDILETVCSENEKDRVHLGDK